MNSNLSKIKEKISKNELVIGTCVSLSDPVISEILCKLSFDFIWIEAEHSTLDKREIDLHIMAITNSGIAPFVRIAWNDSVIVKPILDMGPAAVIFPFIKTAEDVKRAVSSCKYPPRGIRGFGPIRANMFSTISDEEYLTLAKVEPWIVVQIEHIDAIHNLDEILKVDGLDSILVGPNDLSGSMGLLGQTRHPEVLKTLDKISIKCKEADKPFGVCIGFNSQNIIDWINRGVNWIAIGDDFSYIVDGAKKCLDDTVNLYKNLKSKI
jgi:2-dehydro-3-deoxyglucarate aldolase/4-hydroxy-2-oxoheptanedioate aldolase